MIEEKAKVLVVDDEEVVRQSYERSLSAVHCRVKTALNGSQALRIMEEEPCDVVLVDLRMPGMNGIELLSEIKRKWPECEVVIITGYPSIESAKEAVRLGAYTYISKPVGPDEVISAATGAYVQKRWSMRPDNDGRKGEKRFDYRYPWEN